MAGSQINVQQRSRVANPKHVVPEHSLIGIEHPFKIQNPSRAIDSLGGERKITKIVAARESDTFETQLLLHPGRHQLNSVVSNNVPSKSLVCQLTVPKIIGKKRKRILAQSETQSIHAHGLSEMQRIAQSLTDHPDACQLTVLGQCPRIHKFRTLPDFVYSQRHNGFMRRFNSTIGTLKYNETKTFGLADNVTEPQIGMDLIPPPVFSPHTIPFNYVYQQNASVKVVVGTDGEVTALNESTAQRSRLPKVAIDADEVPTKSPAGLIPLSTQPEASKDLVDKLKVLFEERPIWSRRALHCRLQDEKALGHLKWLLQYVGYEFGAGPWAMTVIRYGVDPRNDPSCRFYQSMTLHFEPEARNHPTTTRAHRGGARNLRKKVVRVDKDGTPGYIFTGRTLVLDGKTWQVCDIQDPLISTIFSTNDVRDKCDMDSDGWFKNGTWAKGKVIFRYKARALLKNDLSWIEEDFVTAARMPEEFNPTLKDLPVDTTGWNKNAILIAYNIKHGSLSFGKNRNQWTRHDVSEAVIQALKQHDAGIEDQGRGSEGGLAKLLEEEEDVLRDASGSEELDESENDEGEGEGEGDDE